VYSTQLNSTENYGRRHLKTHTSKSASLWSIVDYCTGNMDCIHTVLHKFKDKIHTLAMSFHFPWVHVPPSRSISLRSRLVTQWRNGCCGMRRSVCNAGASNAGRSVCVQISRERSYPLPIYWYHSKGDWLRYKFAAESFYIMKLCNRLFVLYCRNCPKDDKFEEVRGGVEPWLMARWKARIEFLLSVINFFFYLVWLRRYKAKCVKTRYLQEGVGHLKPRFQGKGSSLGNIFWFLQN